MPEQMSLINSYWNIFWKWNWNWCLQLLLPSDYPSFCQHPLPVPEGCDCEPALTVKTTTRQAGTSESGFWSSRSEKWKRKAFTLFQEAQSEKNTFTLFREVKSEKKMLSLFFEKWKVKSKCFEIEKWKFSRILNNSRETRFFNRFIPWQPNKTAETDGLSVG